MLEVRNLHSFYGDAHVLHGVSLEVKAGEVVALLGRNGMGKTTLDPFHHAAGAAAVRDGSLLWKGEELQGSLRRMRWRPRRIALVPQGRRLFPSLTVIEHLTMLKPASATARLDGQPRVRDVPAPGGAQEPSRQPAFGRRAADAGGRPRADDRPGAGADGRAVRRAWRRSWSSISRPSSPISARLGLAILLVEQNLYSALAVADRLYVLETGKVVHEASAEEIQQGPGPADALPRGALIGRRTAKECSR